MNEAKKPLGFILFMVSFDGGIALNLKFNLFSLQNLENQI
jgi:hypothetical protein